MQRSISIQALINKAKKDFTALKSDYASSLQHQTISEELKVDIKNIFENLRSCLDYLAHDIYEECVGDDMPNRLYFPIRQTTQEFTQAINRDFPNLNSNYHDVYTAVEKIQPYNDAWLAKFNKLNNNNKHQNLEEQTKTQSQHVTVSSPQGGSVSWGSGVTFGSGVFVMGVPIDPNTQMPTPNNQVKTEVVVWVDFKFRENGESVLPFIEKSIENIESLFNEIRQHI